MIPTVEHFRVYSGDGDEDTKRENNGAKRTRTWLKEKLCHCCNNVLFSIQELDLFHTERRTSNT